MTERAGFMRCQRTSRGQWFAKNVPIDSISTRVSGYRSSPQNDSPWKDVCVAADGQSYGRVEGLEGAKHLVLVPKDKSFFTSDPTMSCQFRGCSKPVYPGSLYCSRSHRDNVNVGQDPASNRALRGERSGTNAQHAPVYPGGSRSFSPTLGPGSEIHFYNQGAPYYEFTNFSNHSVWYNQKEYATSEHLFQSLKFTNAADSERIRVQRSPRDALGLAQRMRSQVRKDWISGEQNIKAMNKVLLLKFTQHEDLRNMLLDTADALLLEDSPIDSFWGIGADGKGQNQLGLALMRVRETLRGFESQF